MKQYRLKKELPGLPVGAICYDILYNNPYWKNATHNTFVFNKDDPFFSEWVEELPDFSFVRDGDVYCGRFGESGAVFLMCRDGFVLDFPGRNTAYKHNMGLWSWGAFNIEKSEHKQHITIKNLVYRPDPNNPKGKPLVDKLGWWKEPKRFQIVEAPAHSFIVGEYRDGRLYQRRACFYLRSDAEAFRDHLEQEQKLLGAAS